MKLNILKMIVFFFIDKESNRLKDNQHFQEPIEQSLEKFGDQIFTRYLPTRRWNQIIKKGPSGWIAHIPDLGNR